MALQLYEIQDRPLSSVEPLVQSKDGRIFINPEIRGLTHYYLTMEKDNTGIPRVTLPALGTSRTIFTNDRSAHIQIVKLTYAADGHFLISFHDEGAGRMLQNRPVHILTIGGSGQMPSIFPASLFLDPSRSLYCEMTDLSGSPNVVYMYMSGPRYYYQGSLTSKSVEILESNARKRVAIYFYTTTSDIVLPNLSGETNGRILISEEHDFLLLKFNAVAIDSAGIFYPFLFEIYEESTGRQISNGLLHSTACVGVGAFPYILPQKMLLPRSTALSIRFKNLSGQPQLNVYMTMIGKVFQYPSDLVSSI